MSRAVVWAAVVAGLLAFAPWGNVSVRVLGVWSPVLRFSGTEIDSGLGLGIPAGWIVIAIALAVVVTSRAGRSSIAPTVALALYTAYSAATLSHHQLRISAGSTGADISSLIGAHVTLAWGAVAEVVASIVALVGAVSERRTHAPDVAPEPST